MSLTTLFALIAVIEFIAATAIVLLTRKPKVRTWTDHASIVLGYALFLAAGVLAAASLEG